MAKDPDDRYPSAGDLGRAALAAAGRPWRRPERLVAIGAAAPGDAQETVVSPDQAPTALAGPPPGGRRRWWPWALAAIPVVALVAVLVAVLAADDNGGTPGSTSKSTPTTATTPETVPIKAPTLTGSRPNNIVLASGKAWVVRSGNPRLVVIDAKTVKREGYSPRVGNGPSARRPASASCGSSTRASRRSCRSG